MISQKARTVQKIVVIVIGISIIGLLFSMGVWNSCGINHLSIFNDIEKYENTLDPEFCESVVDRILEYNEQCSDEIEILDCG